MRVSEASQSAQCEEKNFGLVFPKSEYVHCKTSGGVKRASPENQAPSLASLGISKHESSAWQQLAKIPAPEFEQRLAITSRRPIK